ncbi:MAG: GHMP kinase, partial [Pseudomonadota bacterium]
MSTNDITKLPRHDCARAPGKLILSGEHSVVYGAPALATAVNQYTDVWFTPVDSAQGLRTAFENLSPGQFYPLEILKSFKKGLDRRFDAFKRGDLTVKDILQRPDDLALYAIAFLITHHIPMPGMRSKRRLPLPGVLRSKSTLPMGAGMGSSAAVIAATYVLFEHLLGKDHNSEKRFEHVRFCERLQHGYGSAIDAATVVHGGMIRVEGEQVDRLKERDAADFMARGGWYWVMTGQPDVSTGECVAKVSENHADDTQLWDAFAACTNALQDALEGYVDPSAAIKENNRLLRHIGVVPDATNEIIHAIETA